jgi:elongation factor P
MWIDLDNQIFQVVDYQHVKPGKGAAFARVKIKNVRTQQVLERNLKASEKLEDVNLEERKLQYLYHADDKYHFMDNSTYEEQVVNASTLGDFVGFLKDGTQVSAVFHQEEILQINLPTFIEFEIQHTEPGLKGDSSRSSGKPATLETGKIVNVPLFIEIGDVVKIDTRTGAYVERVKK